MSTIFTKIIDGEIPGRFVWRDEKCVAFLDINPASEGHTLLVPRTEVENYWEADPELLAHLARVGQKLAQAQLKAFGTQRVCQVVAGFDVPHLHYHYIPANGMAELELSARGGQAASDEELALAQEKLLKALQELG